MKNFFFLVIISILFVFSGTHNLVKADVYGYDLSVKVYDNSSQIQNNSCVNQPELQNGNLLVSLKAIDPADANKVFEVTQWQVWLTREDSDGNSLNVYKFFVNKDGKIVDINTPVDWQITNLVASNNKLSFNLATKTENPKLVIWSKASIGESDANSVNFKVCLTNPITPSPEPTVKPIITVPPAITAGPTPSMPSTITSMPTIIPSVVATIQANQAASFFAASKIYIYTALSIIFLVLLLFFFLPKRKGPWGKIVDARSGKPLVGINVSLIQINQNSENSIDQTKTDDKGYYRFIESAGNFKLTTNSREYQMTSAAGSYAPGGTFAVSEDKTPQIPDIVMIDAPQQ